MAHPEIATDLYTRLEIEADARRLRASFAEFAERAWYEIDPAPLKRGWFIDLLWGELERWARGDIRKLIIAVPPGSSKSLSASVLLQAWMWTLDPSQSLLAYSSTQDLAIRDNLRMRDLVTSEWYTERFCQDWHMHESQRQKKRFRNSAMGERYGIGGQNRPTGWRGDQILIDDPVDANPRKPPRPEDLEAAYQAVQYLLRTRVNNPATMRALMIMQRLHEDDPVGRLLKAEPDEWHTVYFDAICDPRMPHRHHGDKRKEGEVLLPERGQTPDSLEKDRIALGSDTFNAQYQQMPAAAGGMIIKPEWIQYYTPGEEPKTSYTITSWDCAFKGNETSSWVVGTVWGVEAPDDPHLRRFVLRDVVREHLDYAATKRAIERLSLRWPGTDLTIVEDKANGPAVISELSYKIPTIVGFSPNPYGDKEQRLRSVSPIWEAGKVWLPREAPWLKTYIEEITRFPKFSTNDQVDSTTQSMLGCTQELESLLSKAGQNKDLEFFTVDW